VIRSYQMSAEVFSDCTLPGHEWRVEVDEQDTMYASCVRADGSYHGDAAIFGPVTPARAAALRRHRDAFVRVGRGRAYVGTSGGRRA
jgi:hypothetical protein